MELFHFLSLFCIYAIPMYLANAAPVILHGTIPIDGKKKLLGQRILGDGKTILGFFNGILVGSASGALMYFIIPLAQTIPLYFSLVVSLAIGALIGDSVKSFFKRRLGIERGKQWALVDQLDFIVGGLIISTFVRIPEVEVVLALLIITVFMHSGFNYLAFKLKLKNVPW